MDKLCTASARQNSADELGIRMLLESPASVLYLQQLLRTFVCNVLVIVSVILPIMKSEVLPLLVMALFPQARRMTNQLMAYDNR